MTRRFDSSVPRPPVYSLDRRTLLHLGVGSAVLAILLFVAGWLVGSRTPETPVWPAQRPLVFLPRDCPVPPPAPVDAPTDESSVPRSDRDTLSSASDLAPKGAPAGAASTARVGSPSRTAAPVSPLLVDLAFDERHETPAVPYGRYIHWAARRYRLNVELVAALVEVESGFDRWAVSAKGARGLMQVMPATAQRFGVEPDDLYDVRTNLETGTRYLSWLRSRFANNSTLVVAAYNAGEHAVQRVGGVPPYRETMAYIERLRTVLGPTAAGPPSETLGRVPGTP